MSGERTLEIASSPHLHAGYRVDRIMRQVIYALVPVCVFAVLAFGWSALFTLAMALGASVLTEQLCCRAAGKASTLPDGSVIITGLLFGLTLPPHLPLWMTALGAAFGVGVGKGLFGGLGCNPFNPALVGRAFLQAAFPSAMTTWMPAWSSERWAWPAGPLWTAPLTAPQYDGLSSATPLALAKFEGRFSEARELAFGLTSGSAGETCALLILLGGAYLAARRMLDWRIPAAILGTVAVLSLLCSSLDPARYGGPLFMLCSGGLMLGAVFMATDMVASPVTHAGSVVYGVLIGVLVVSIRYWGGMPEGVMYAILFANAVSPHIDHWMQPRIFGARKTEAGHAG